MSSEKSAGVHIPPPAVFVIALGGAWLVHRTRPLPVFSREWIDPGRAAGVALILAGAGLAAAALTGLLRAGTSPHPATPTSTLVTAGVYRFTRNPIYLGMACLSEGVGLLANSFWVLGSVLPALVVLRYAVIAKEERYLTERFGEPYREYRARVRRWL